MKHRNWFWGAFFILAAVAVMAYQFGFLADVGLRNIVFTIPLAAVLIYSLAHRQFVGVFFPAGVILYLFRNQLGLAGLEFWPIVIAAVLLSIGFQLIFGTTRFVHIGMSGEDFPSEALGDANSNEVVCEASFGAASKYIYSQNLEKVYLRASFSGLKVYFDQAQLSPEGAEVHMECSLSGIELYIPRAWRIDNQLHAAIGGVEEKHRRPQDVSPDGPILRLRGNISIGGVEIIYV